MENQSKPRKRTYAVRMVEMAHGGMAFEDLVKERRAQGMSFRKIGEEFGISWMTVWRHSGETADEAVLAAAS